MALLRTNHKVFGPSIDMLVRTFHTPIFHMASMARSGETLLLRTLQAHPKIHVVHNLRKTDDNFEEKLFKYLMNHQGATIWRGNRYLRGVKIQSNQVLLLKQSVWEHRYPFKGFVLARNPLSIFASLKFYDVPKGQNDWEVFWKENSARFIRWLNDIDPELVAGFEKLNPVQQFCSFYNRRMEPLSRTGLPIIYYEKFVRDPESSLREILRAFNLPWENQMLQSHMDYQKGEEGHGKVDLSHPITAESIYKYQELLSESEFSEIVQETKNVFGAYGYDLGWTEMKINGESISS